ncbi:MAG: hypothetical protein ABIG43_03135 [Chloroflexota bacterium]
MREEHQQPPEGLMVEAVKLDKASINQSCIKPHSLPEGIDRFLLVPVECPKGIYEKRVIVPAFYEAHCTDFSEFPYKDVEKVGLGWNFFYSDCPDLSLRQHLNIFKIIKSTHLYSQQWIMVNHGRRPRVFNRERMTPQIFSQKRAIVCVRASRPKFPDNTLMPEECSGAVVGYIKEVIDD